MMTVEVTPDTSTSDTVLEGNSEGKEGLSLEDGNQSISPCPVCQQEPSQPLLLSCLHPVCQACVSSGSPSIVCPKCRVSTNLSSGALVPDILHRGEGEGGGNIETSVLPLLVREAKRRTEMLPTQVNSLTNNLGDLQEQRDNVRSLIEETYQSYRAMLESCKDTALEELEERHKKKELIIMEKLEHYDVTETSLEHAWSYTDKLLTECSNSQVSILEPTVSAHMRAMLDKLDRNPTCQLNNSLAWQSDSEQFSSCLKRTFGRFTTNQADSMAQTIIKTDSPVQLPSLGQLVTTSPLGQVTSSPGLLSACQLPLSSPSLSVPLSPLPSHGPIGSSLSSPAHQRSLGLSHPDLSGLTGQNSPTALLSRRTTPPQDTFNLASQLASMAEKLGEQQRSTSSLNLPVGNSNPAFTLADLISNVGTGDEGEEGGPRNWVGSDSVDVRHQTQGPGQQLALSNIAALAKLEEYTGGGHSPRWGAPPDPNLLLPDLNRDIGGLTRSLSNLGSDSGVSPGTHSLISPGNHSLVSPGGGHSLSPVLGGTLTVPGMMGGGLQRGTSPISPIDNLMGLHNMGSVSPLPPNILTQPILRSGINMGGLMSQPGSAQPRALNSMQIRCKFGQLGPGKGQFNSPHGFCLGLEEEIIVADTNNHRIQVFEKNGTYRYQFGIPGKEEGQLWYPRKVAVMKNSGKFVVCDRGNERSRMQIFTKHGHFVRKIAIRYIDIVAGLAITRDGNIVAVDSVTPTMFVISEQGELLRWFDCADYMREPSDIAVGGREFYVCDFKGHNVVVFTEDGVFVRRIGCENITNFPNGIDISDAGDILIGDSHGNRFHVAVFANDGGLLAEFECPHVKVSRCCGLKITSEGYVVTLAKNNHHVLVLNTLYIA